jgi:phenylacetate 2-hydroxylase
MTIPIYIAGVAVLGFFLYQFLYGTDTPHIKGLPEVPGLPLFGSLYELGTNHAKVAQGWAKKYGPVFQVRMGNRVSGTRTDSKTRVVTDLNHRGLSSPTHSIRSVIFGSQTNRPSFHVRPCTLSTQWSPPHKVSPSVLRHGTSHARTAAKLPLPR